MIAECGMIKRPAMVEWKLIFPTSKWETPLPQASTRTTWHRLTGAFGYYQKICHEPELWVFITYFTYWKFLEVWFSLSTAGFCWFEIHIPPSTLSRCSFLSRMAFRWPRVMFWPLLDRFSRRWEVFCMLADAKISFHFPMNSFSRCRLVDLEVIFQMRAFCFFFWVRCWQFGGADFRYSGWCSYQLYIDAPKIEMTIRLLRRIQSRSRI